MSLSLELSSGSCYGGTCSQSLHIKSLTAKSGSSLISKLTDLEIDVFVFLGIFFIYVSSWCQHIFLENETMISLFYWILSLVFSVFSLHVSKVDLITCELLWSQSGWNSQRFFFSQHISHNNKRATHTLCSFNKSLQFRLNLFPSPLSPEAPRANEPFSSIKQGELV